MNVDNILLGESPPDVPEPYTILLCYPLLLLTGRLLMDTYKMDTYKQQISTYAKDLYGKFIGVERRDKQDTKIYRNLHDFEYGSKSTNLLKRDIYCKGIFYNDELHGPGRRVVETRDIHVFSRGIFKKDMLHGRGMKIMTNKIDNYSVCFDGMFRRDMIHGKASIRCKYYTVEGTFDRGVFLRGSITIHEYNVYAMDTRYKHVKSVKGNFGKHTEYFYDTRLPLMELNGHGTVTYHKTMYKSKETGGFKGGVLSGYGERYTTTHAEKGMFKNGCLNGAGTYVYATHVVTAEFRDGYFVGAYDVDFDDINIHCRDSTFVQITFRNGDIMTFTPKYDMRIYIYAPQLFKNMFNRAFTDISYTLKDNIEHLDKLQFMYWLFSMDRGVYDMVCDSNLNNFIDGSLYMSFQSPIDFDLPEVNDNVLERLLELKHTDTSSDDGIVLVTKIV